MPRGTSLYDAARVQRRLWTPGVVRRALWGWWDAGEVGSLVLTSGRVTTMRDLTGTGRTLTASTGPVWSANGVRGYPAMTFAAATGERLRRTSAGISGTVLTVWLVGSLASTAASYGRAVSVSDDGDVNDYSDAARAAPILRSSSAASVTGFRANTEFPALGVTYDQPWIAEARFDGTNYTLRRNGTANTPTASSGTFGSNTVCWGANAGKDQERWAGLGIALIIALAALDRPTSDRIEGYLAWRVWPRGGNPLAAGHPYKNRPPLIGG